MVLLLIKKRAKSTSLLLLLLQVQLLVFVSFVSKSFLAQASFISSPTSRSTSTSTSTSTSASSHLRCAKAIDQNETTPISSSSSSSSSSSPCTNQENGNKSEMITWRSSPSSTQTQTRQETQQEMITYLYKNLMSFDNINAESLGFPPTTQPETLPPDGLSHGIIGPTINITIYAKTNYPWAQSIPKPIFFEYVANFANVNEARSNWRAIFHEYLIQPILQPFLQLHPNPTIEDVVQLVNTHIWSQSMNDRGNSDGDNRNIDEITFKHGQTPLIYDPMSILIYRYASCTGLSIFLINALRTVGIPARMAGTPAWNGKIENGNHSWIEFYGSDSKWHIMESKPAAGGGIHKDVDLYDPCQWWFCNSEKVENTTFYAARLDREESDSVFPMAWDLDNQCVVGEDRTDFMRELCSNC